MSADYPTGEDTPTASLLRDCVAAPVKINQGPLSDGLLFATHNARDPLAPPEREHDVDPLRCCAVGVLRTTTP